VHKVYKVFKGQQDLQEPQAHKVPLARQEQLGLKVILVIPELLARLDLQVQQAQKDLLAILDRQGQLVLKAKLGQLDLKVFRGKLVRLVPLVHKVQQVLKASKASRVSKVQQEQQGQPELREPLGLKVHRE
jgi:hypothetical protein